MNAQDERVEGAIVTNDLSTLLLFTGFTATAESTLRGHVQLRVRTLRCFFYKGKSKRTLSSEAPKASKDLSHRLLDVPFLHHHVYLRPSVMIPALQLLLFDRLRLWESLVEASPLYPRWSEHSFRCRYAFDRSLDKTSSSEKENARWTSLFTIECPSNNIFAVFTRHRLEE